MLEVCVRLFVVGVVVAGCSVEPPEQLASEVRYRGAGADDRPGGAAPARGPDAGADPMASPDVQPTRAGARAPVAPAPARLPPLRCLSGAAGPGPGFPGTPAMTWGPVDFPAEMPLPPGGDRTCDETCQNDTTVVTICPEANPGCSATRSSTVVWTLNGRRFAGMLLRFVGDRVRVRVDSGEGRAMGWQMVMAGRGRVLLKSDLDVAITTYGIEPVWGGTTRLFFEGSIHTSPTTTTFFYRMAQASELAGLGQQLHAGTIGIIRDEQEATGIVPTEPSRAYFIPTELIMDGEGDQSFGDGRVEINYGNPEYWTVTPALTHALHEFAHEYAHEIFDDIPDRPFGAASCLDEGLADALGNFVGRIPDTDLGPLWADVDITGDCRRVSEMHAVGNCYLFHAKRAGLFNRTFFRGLYHPQHRYQFDSCDPGARQTGDSLLVLFSEAARADATCTIDSMSAPDSGSYPAARAALGF